MNRRQALQQMAVLMSVSPLTALAIEHYPTHARPAADGTFFTADEQKLVAEIAQLIIPTTATPGAGEVGVPAFIEVDTRAKALGNNFLALSPEAKNGLLSQLETEAQQNHSRVPTFWQLLKELTLIGYFTSETGMTKAMHYVSVPGRVETIKLKPGQKAYSEYVDRFW
jgi:hypothetical protein